MRQFALSAIGRDRPGIVAAVSRVLLAHGINVEDSQMSILRGHFTMTLIVAAGERASSDELRVDLARVGRDLGLEAISLSEVAELPGPGTPQASHIVSVYGADHPGIVHAVSATLAGCDVNISALTTRLVGEDRGEPLYVMIMEVAAPETLDLDGLAQILEPIGLNEGVDVSVRVLEQDAL